MLRFSGLVLLLSVTGQVLADACLIQSSDDQLPIRLCQQNISIPAQLFRDSFCQPQIPDRSFTVSLMDSCPQGAYGVCLGAQSQGVGYRQSIHYYTDPADEPVLKAYCEQFSAGTWQAGDRSATQNLGGDDR